MIVASSALGVILGVVLLAILLWKGYHPCFAVPFCALIVLLFSGISPLDGMISGFGSGFGSVFSNIFLIIMGGSFLGSAIIKTGSATTIAETLLKIFPRSLAITSLILACSIMSFAGMGWGAVITTWSIGRSMCKTMNYSHHIMAGVIFGGTNTCAAFMPFSGTAQNTLMGLHFGTHVSAGLVPGMIAAIFCFVFECFYLERTARKWKKNGKYWKGDHVILNEVYSSENKPGIIKSFTPLIAVAVCLNIFKIHTAIACVVGAVICIILNLREIPANTWLSILNESCKNSVAPIVSTCLTGGFAGVIAMTPIFSDFINWMASNTFHPYFLAVLSSSSLTAVIGSSVSACNIIGTTMTEMFVELASQYSANMDNIHRLVLINSTAWGCLPNNGSIVATNSAIHTSLKDSYIPVFVINCIGPTIAGVFIALPLSFILL